MALSARLLTLRRSPILLQLPPYISALCVLVGIAWLFVLPLNDYSRQTYVSENAILPGQVHTYFGGSDHNVFRAYRQEVFQLSQQSEEVRVAGLGRIIRENGLKLGYQPYSYTVSGEAIAGTNIYGLLQGPRADATEAMVLIAAWRNFNNEVNYSGVALALTLARYFKRWSIWSKDIILLISADSVYGPEAWVSAYHSTPADSASPHNISALPIKAGALQAAVALDYPAGPWGHRFDKLDVLYDGINGALPNLDLLNTAVSVASGQMGIGCSIHGMTSHSDSYVDRLTTLAKGVLTQGAGHATGPHSAFMPYHVDAITLKTVGDGWHDEMSLGRTTESLFRSINNLLEHLHQSFFFYTLLNSNRFVSIGNYLPAAMLLAGNFTVTALALWAQSGSAPVPFFGLEKREKSKLPEMELVKSGSDVALVPKAATETVERHLFLPTLIVLAIHLASFVPLVIFNHVNRSHLSTTLHTATIINLLLPGTLSYILTHHLAATRQHLQVTQCLSLLLLGAALSTLATLNFSLALIVGVLCSPLSFVRPLPRLQSSGASAVMTGIAALLHSLISPPAVLRAVGWFAGKDVGWLLAEAARGWAAQGVWTALVVWSVWWPAWVIAGVVLYSGRFARI